MSHHVFGHLPNGAIGVGRCHIVGFSGRSTRKNEQNGRHRVKRIAVVAGRFAPTFQYQIGTGDNVSGERRRHPTVRLWHIGAESLAQPHHSHGQTIFPAIGQTEVFGHPLTLRIAASDRLQVNKSQVRLSQRALIIAHRAVSFHRREIDKGRNALPKGHLQQPISTHYNRLNGLYGVRTKVFGRSRCRQMHHIIKTPGCQSVKMDHVALHKLQVIRSFKECFGSLAVAYQS